MSTVKKKRYGRGREGVGGGSGGGGSNRSNGRRAGTLCFSLPWSRLYFCTVFFFKMFKLD